MSSTQPELTHIRQRFFETFLEFVPPSTKKIIISTWVSIDGVKHFAPELRKLLSAGIKIDFIVGGIFGSKTNSSGSSIGSFLQDIHEFIYKSESLKPYFRTGRLSFYVPNTMEKFRPVHSKVWAALDLKDQISQMAIGSVNFSVASLKKNQEEMMLFRSETQVLQEIYMARIKPLLSGNLINWNGYIRHFEPLQSQIKPKPSEKVADNGIKIPFGKILSRTQGISLPDSDAELARSSINYLHLSDFFLIFRDPRKGAKTAFKMPETIIANIFEEKFLAGSADDSGKFKISRETFLLPSDLVKKIEQFKQNRSSIKSKYVRPTMIGDCIHSENKESFAAEQREQNEAQSQLANEIKAVSSKSDFKTNFMNRLEESLNQFIDSYKSHLEMQFAKKSATERKKFIKQLVQKNSDNISSELNKSLNALIGGLTTEKSFFFLRVDKALEQMEGGVNVEELITELME